MDEILEAAPEAVEEVIAVEETVVDESEAPEQEAPQDEEKKSRNERRREAREKSQAALQEAITAKIEAESKLANIKKAAEQLPAPKQSEFTNFEDYQAALTAFHVTRMTDNREAQKIEAEARDRFANEQAIRTAQRQADAENWASQVQDASKKYSDFQEVALYSAPIDQRMADQLVQSDAAAEIAYYLGKNPEIGRQIAAMPDLAMARALGRLEAQLSAPQTKTVSTAPSPITPVRGKSPTPNNPEKMDAKQYAEWRAKGGTFKL